MREIIDRRFRLVRERTICVLDVGSMSVNRSYPHTYREHMPPAWIYRGCDIAPGKNVDLVQADPYILPAVDGEFDMVISGQCLEHVRYPFKLVAEMARVMKSGGAIILTAPWNQREHRYPKDYWRIFPDAMHAMMEDAGLHCIEAYTRENDCWALGVKPN